MKALLIVLIGLNLGLIVVEDFRERRISLAGLVLLALLSAGYFCLEHPLEKLPERCLANILFIVFILVSGTLLVKIRRPEDSAASFIGTGDILFLIAISPMFSFVSYLVFLNTSIVLVLLTIAVLMMLKRFSTSDTIPLAGALALTLLLFKSAELILHIDFPAQLSSLIIQDHG